MTVVEAIGIIEQTANVVVARKSEHVILQQAIEVIRKALEYTADKTKTKKG